MEIPRDPRILICESEFDLQFAIEDATTNSTLISGLDEETLEHEYENLDCAFSRKDAGPDQSPTVHSPSDDLHDIPDMELDCQMDTDTIPDYGELDDLLHQAQMPQSRALLPLHQAGADFVEISTAHLKATSLPTRRSFLRRPTFAPTAKLDLSIQVPLMASPLGLGSPLLK